jgi:hypothetical protein
MRYATPAAFSTEPTLDGKVLSGFDAWLDAAASAGPIRTTQWLERRSIGAEFPYHMIFAGIDRLLKQPRPIDLAAGAPICEDLADRLLTCDQEMAEVFLQPVIRWAMEIADVELLLRSGSTATGILNSFDEPRSVGRLWVDVLNWTRTPDLISKVDLIEHAFEQVISAAERDGAQLYAARLEFEQVQFHRQHGDLDEVVGEWRPDRESFAVWYAKT